MNEHFEAVRDIMKSSWMQEDDYTLDEILFTTRMNGNVGDETPGQKDIDHAKEMKARILKEVSGVNVEVDTCDEWTNLTVRII